MGDVAATVANEISDAQLQRRALDVLSANSLGRATSPSLRLYPHQWSWDSACIAMGYAAHDQERAETELRSLFAGQWRNGMLPHIVFTEGGRYFPGPEFWQTERASDAPARPRTSGLVQPPLHATAALRVYRRATDRSRAETFLAELFPRLGAWHEYLHRERARDGETLVEIWHPWESGMDNSPLWDDALAAIDLEAADVPDYRRVDVDVAVAAERPSDEHYDRFAYLVDLFRTLEYRPERIREQTPFALQPVLFNSALVQAERDLAELARLVGEDPRPAAERAERSAASLDKLWDEERGVYVDFDLANRRHVRTWTSAGFAPLYAGVPTAARAARVVEQLFATGVAVAGGSAATSLPLGDPRFEPTLYWRGPVWPILNWFLYWGLRRYGYAELAHDVRRAVTELAARGDFWEHYDPFTGRGHGGPRFAWTAGIVLDLIGSSTTNSIPDAPE